MAYAQPNDIQPAQPAQQQGPINAGGALGAGIGGATKTAANTPGQNTPAQPSAQLSAYINANQPQTQALAGTVANQVGGQVQAAGNAIQPAVNTYTGQQYTVPTDATVNQQVATAPSQLTPQQTGTYQTELGAAANAPNSANTFETTPAYTDLAGNIQSAVTQANLWNSGNNPANLSTALQPFESPTATQGDTTLDALLLSGNPQAYGTIESAVAPAANLQSQLTAGTTQADQSLQNAIAQDTATTAAAQAAPQTYANNLTSYLTNAVNQATQGDQAANAQILSDLQNNTPTPTDLSTLGVTPEQWTQLSSDMAGAAAANVPISLQNYLTQSTPTAGAAGATGPGVYTPSNEASAQQYADIAALQSILGANAPTEPITSATANQAGTAPSLASLDQFNYANADKAAANNATVAGLEAQANAYASEIAQANDSWAGTQHFAGMNADQFNQYVNSLNGGIADINAQIQAILGQSPGYLQSPGVANTAGSPGIAQQVQGYIPGISEIGSAVGDIGSFLGI